jgi:hypothetical protein
MERVRTAAGLAVGVALIVAGIFITFAMAARPSVSGPASLAATLTVTPNPAAAGSSFHAGGCGFAVDRPVNIVLSGGATQTFFAVGADVNGCLSFDGFAGGSGSYTLQGFQNINGSEPTLMAKTAFSVH